MITNKHVAITQAKQLAKKYDTTILIYLFPQDDTLTEYDLFFETDDIPYRNPADYAVNPDGSIEH